MVGGGLARGCVRGRIPSRGTNRRKTLKTETAVHCGGSAGWQGSWQSDLKENTRGKGEKLPWDGLEVQIV